MLSVPQAECIRTLRDVEGKSIAEIARIMGVCWRTAKKYADGQISLGEKPRQRRRRPVVGEYIELIDAWLEEDLLMPAKQRRTARAIYRKLKKLGYQGSERAVRGYVRKRKLELRVERAEKLNRLEHAPGEAQVDFGHCKVVKPYPENQLQEQPYLVLSFPNSNAHCWRLLPAENSECFLYGLKSIFEEIGGVPPQIWFDNLSPAVSHGLDPLSWTPKDLGCNLKEGCPYATTKATVSTRVPC